MTLAQRSVFMLALAASVAFGGEYTKTEQSTRLYTAPDSAAAGGIRVQLETDDRPIQVLAMLQTDANRCYAGAWEDGAWVFRGLPVGKYDLAVVFHDRFYEGCRLTRETNSLSKADLASIKTIMTNSVPFFDTKVIHRAEGVGGKGGKAALVLQEVRTRPITLQSAEVRADIQVRSLKLAFLEEVHVGWQLVNTRELIRMEVGGTMRKGVLPHQYVAKLGNIRVTDSIKELGVIRLK